MLGMNMGGWLLLICALALTALLSVMLFARVSA